MVDPRRGFLFGVAAYALWGAFPLYWPLLEPAGAIEILAHRIVWSLVVMLVLVLASSRVRQFKAIVTSPRTRSILTFAAVLIAVNWGTYIWGVNNGHVVECALGYFMNPLVTVLMGVVVIGERLRPLQWAAMVLAAVAVIALTFQLGRPPWVAIALALSFGSYGLAKKKADVGAVESLAFETVVITPIALGYLVYLGFQGESSFGNQGVGHALLLISTGIVTAVPLICFGAAATSVSMTTLGLLQYMTPSIQFVLGVYVYHEAMPAGRLLGYGFVWLALALFTFEALHHHRQQLRLTTEASAI